jgi:CubicO group peptidase (beta-lactamase class C family)
MPYLILLLITFILGFPAAASAVGPRPPLSAILDIDFLMEQAASHGLIAGGVVLIGNRTGATFERAYGRMSADPLAPPMRTDVIFDVASLTKVVATTPAIMKLAEESTLLVTDPVAAWFPEFGREEKKELLVMHLLTHTSGIEDFPLASPDPLRQAVERCASRPLRGVLGNSFSYADMNFILLGDLVHRASGITLDRYTAERFFAPLGMVDTFFTPTSAMKSRLSATVLPDRALLTGEPQDFHARQLGGVAGHAGLFSTAADLARFCRMLMNGGELDGRRVLAARTVAQMTAPRYAEGGKVIRGMGWDIASPYSSPRGHGFSEFSFGHTGYSGASIWIDPKQDLFVVLLTARLDFRRIGEFNQLRRDLSTIAVSSLTPVGRGSTVAGPF